jgi:hypothetical protein
MPDLCPFCRSPIPAGASVCAACNATYIVPDKSNFALYLGLVFFGVGVLMLLTSKDAPAWIPLGLGSIIVGIHFFFKKFDRPRWVRKIG